jgi:hypothetical protein
MTTEVRSQAAGPYGIRSLAVLLLLGHYVAVFLDA